MKQESAQPVTVWQRMAEIRREKQKNAGKTEKRNESLKGTRIATR